MTVKRFLSEWEPQSSVLIAIPHIDTDWSDMIDEVIECYRNIILAILKSEEIVYALCRDIEEAREILNLPTDKNLVYIEVPINDTWIRDYGPLSILNEDGNISLLDFGFNAWGLKFAADKDNLVNERIYRQGFLHDKEYVNLRGFILEGGSVESDGNGTILTTSSCLLSPNRNPNYSKAEIETFLHNSLGAKSILWLTHGYLAGDDTDSHIDTLARLCPNDTILYTSCDDESDEHYEELSKMEHELASFITQSGQLYNLLKLPLPDPIYDPNDETRLPATYANYLVLNKSVLVPIYNQHEKDSLACQMIQMAYPDKEILVIDCNALIRQHGSLHCSTMQIPK